MNLCFDTIASHVVRRRDHFVTMCVCARMCVCGECQQDKTKTPDRNNLKLYTAVVLDSLSIPVDFGFKRSRVRAQGHHSNFWHPVISVERMQLHSANFSHKMHYGRLLPPDQKWWRNTADVTEY